VTLELVARQLR